MTAPFQFGSKWLCRYPLTSCDPLTSLSQIYMKSMLYTALSPKTAEVLYVCTVRLFAYWLYFILLLCGMHCC